MFENINFFNLRLLQFPFKFYYYFSKIFKNLKYMFIEIFFRFEYIFFFAVDWIFVKDYFKFLTDDDERYFLKLIILGIIYFNLWNFLFSFQGLAYITFCQNFLYYENLERFSRSKFQKC